MWLDAFVYPRGMVPRSAMAATAAELAEIRHALAPEEGEPGTKIKTCTGCGQTFICVEKEDRTYCADCGMVRQMDGNTQMRLKMGPVYEKAARAQFKFWRSELARLGITPPD